MTQSNQRFQYMGQLPLDADYPRGTEGMSQEELIRQFQEAQRNKYVSGHMRGGPDGALAQHWNDKGVKALHGAAAAGNPMDPLAQEEMAREALLRPRQSPGSSGLNIQALIDALKGRY